MDDERSSLWVCFCVCVSATLLSLGLAGCGRDSNLGAPLDTTEGLALGAPAHAAVSPDTNPATPARVALGRDLFWDPILSGGRDVACATCHHPALGYADGRRTSVGVGGRGLGSQRVAAPGIGAVARNAMTVVDVAFNGLTLDGPVDPAAAPMFWDNRTRSLERQALEPIANAAEMRGSDFTEAQIVPELVRRLAAIPGYVAQFEGAFGSTEVTGERIAAAIAAFERSLVVTDASFDRYMRGDTGALTAQQVRGMDVFQASGCGGCHAGPMFSDFELHAIGVPEPPGVPRDPGDGAGRFRTASLRFVTQTGPYMHNGVFASLDAVLRHYALASERAPDPALRRVRPPRGEDAAALIAFLEALSDGTLDTRVPERVPSGLPVGGAIR